MNGRKAVECKDLVMGGLAAQEQRTQTVNDPAESVLYEGSDA